MSVLPRISNKRADGIGEPRLTKAQADALDRLRESRGWGVGRPSLAPAENPQLRQSRILCFLSAVGLIALLWCSDAEAASSVGTTTASASVDFRIVIPARIALPHMHGNEQSPQGAQQLEDVCPEGRPRLTVSWP